MTPKPTPQKNPNTALIAGGILFVLLLVGLVWYLLSSESTPSPTPTPSPPSPPSPPSTDDEGSSDDVIDDDTGDDGTQTNDKKVNCKRAFKKNCSSLTSIDAKTNCCYRQSPTCTTKSCGIEPVTTDGYCCNTDPDAVEVCAELPENDCNNEKACNWFTTPCSTPTTTGACCTNELNSDFNCGILDQSDCTDTYSGNKSGCKWYGSGCEGKAWCIPKKGEGTGNQDDAIKCMSLNSEDDCNSNENCQWGKNYVPTNGASCVVNPKVTNKNNNPAACSSSSTGWPDGKNLGCEAIDNKKDCNSPKHGSGEKCCKWMRN